MSRARSDGPLAWNVAGLLADDAGATRSYPVTGVMLTLAADDAALGAPIEGMVVLRHTNRGVIAEADLSTALATQCSRCLVPLSVPVSIRVEEEYLPALDLTTGRPLPIGDEPDASRLDDHHELDLETPVREAILLAEPIAPVCRPDCPGLCIVCGLELAGPPHDHPDDDIDPRLAALKGFRVDGEPRNG
jgi:uncharacterized protein